MTRLSIVSDAAVSFKRDALAFDRYLEPLVAILSDKSVETPFTIGIFGTWGSGKSSLLKMLDEKLEEEHAEDFIRVHFNPWVYRGEDNMLVPLLHTLHDTLDEDPMKRFKSSVDKLANVLLRLGADLFLKTVTAHAVSVEELEKLEVAYLKERGQVKSEIRKLRETLRQEANAIAKNGAKIVFFIDDLDRCEPDEIIDLLESIKLFLDLQNIFVILAVDKELIDRGIEVKYAKFELSRSRKLALGAEYLEKMVQLPLQLYPLRVTQVRRFIENFGTLDAITNHLDLLQTVMVPNPRKIKRVLNILAVSSDIIKRTSGLTQLNPDLLARLAVLQVQAGDLYAEIAKLPELLIALEGLNATPPEFDIDEPGSFTRFGAHRDTIIELCRQYHRPSSFLGPLFSGAKFSQVNSEDLPLYLSMLGV